MERNKEALEVKRALYRRGLTMRGWCERHGYSYRTALNAVDRHAGGHAREPWGQTTRAILRDLSREIGREIIPGILKEAA